MEGLYLGLGCSQNWWQQAQKPRYGLNAMAPPNGLLQCRMCSAAYGTDIKAIDRADRGAMRAPDCRLFRVSER